MAGLSYFSLPHEVWQIIIGLLPRDCINQIFESPLQPEWSDLINERFFRNVKLGMDYRRHYYLNKVEIMDAWLSNPDKLMALSKSEKSLIRHIEIGCPETHNTLETLAAHKNCKPITHKVYNQIKLLHGVRVTISCPKSVSSGVLWSSVDLVCVDIDDFKNTQTQLELDHPESSFKSLTLCCQDDDVPAAPRLTKIPFLTPFMNIEELILSINMGVKLSSLTRLPKLRSLAINLSDTHFVSINGLANLEHLKLDRVRHEQELNLNKLSNLKSLEINHAQLMEISNIEGLPDMLQLTHLNLAQTGIKNIDSLSGLLNLQYLNLSNNYISNTKALAPLIKIKHLHLHTNLITDVDGIQDLVDLEYLDLTYNEITNIENLKTLSKIVYLSLGSNQVTEIPDLSSLVNLEELDLSVNNISKIQGLELLNGLQNLYLDGNKIPKIEGLANLVRLKELNLKGNCINEIDNLDSLTELTSLDITSNQISKIRNLGNLLNLSSLSLDRNEIEKIENLNELVNLRFLALNYNRINRIEGLDMHVDLSISLRANNISQFEIEQYKISRPYHKVF